MPHLNQDFWSAGSTPIIPSVLGGPWRDLNVAGRLFGGPGPPEAAPDLHKAEPGGSKQKPVGTLLFFLNVDL